MDTIVFGDGIGYSTDYVASIPTPKRLYVRLPSLNMVEAMQLATNEIAMSKIIYKTNSFFGCSIIAVANENGTPKISASYQQHSRGE